MTIYYTKGDATQPKGNRLEIITHLCNDIGGWGKDSPWPFPSDGNSPSNNTESGMHLGRIFNWEKYSSFKWKQIW